MKPNGSISTEWMGEGFLLFGKNYYFTEKLCFLVNNLFEKVFQISKVIGLITLLSNCMRNSDAKKVFILFEKVFSSMSVHLPVLAYLV